MPTALLAVAALRAAAGPVCGAHCASDADCAVVATNCTWCLGRPNPNVPKACTTAPTSCRGGPPPPARTALPQYLVMGDSVSHGYSTNGHLTDRLLANGVFEAVPVDAGGGGQCGDSSRGLSCLRAWIGSNESRFDLVSWNFGLHDLGKSTWDGPNGVPLAQYAANLRNISRLLSRRLPSAQQLFVTTTPVPSSALLSPPRNESDVRRYNSAAKAAMAAEGVPVLDLWAWAVAGCEPSGGADDYAECPAGCAELPGGESEHCLQRANNVHFWPQGYSRLVDAIEAAAKQLHYGGACPDFLKNITIGVC